MIMLLVVRPALPEVSAGTDLRVLLPEDERFAILAEKLAGLGVQIRRARYLVEDEAVTAPPGARHLRTPVKRSLLAYDH